MKDYGVDPICTQSFSIINSYIVTNIISAVQYCLYPVLIS